MIYAKNIDSILQSIPQSKKIFLLYGPDETVIQHCIDKITTRVKASYGEGLEMINMEFAQLKDEPSILLELLYNMSLFYTNKMVIIRNCAASKPKDIEIILEKVSNGDNILIFVCGDLSKTSTMRTLFESKEPRFNGTLIACYKPDTIQIRKVILEAASKIRLTFDEEALNVFMQLAPNNLNILYNEIEKLHLYKGDQNVTLEDVLSIYSNESDFSLDDLCLSILKRDPQFMLKSITRILHHNVHYMLIIRTVINFLQKLLYCKYEMMRKRNVNPEEVIKSLKPAVFFKQRDNLLYGLSRQCDLDNNDVINMMKELTQVEIACKTSNHKPTDIVTQAFIRMCATIS